MLKLMKMEGRAMGRLLLPLYGALLVLSLLIGGSAAALSVRASFNRAATVFGWLSLIYMILIIATAVVGVILVISRFSRGLLGSEGYFAFSLPVSTAQLLGSRLLSAILWTVLGVLTAVLSALLAGGVAALADRSGMFRGEFSQMFTFLPPGQALGQVLLVVLSLLVSLAGNILKLYAAMAIGYQWSDHPITGSVAVFIGFSIAESVLGTVLQTIRGVPFFMGFYLMDSGSTAGMLIALTVSAAGAGIYWVLTWYFLDRRLALA